LLTVRVRGLTGEPGDLIVLDPGQSVGPELSGQFPCGLVKLERPAAGAPLL
jgi:hypothetical protein